MLTSTLSPNSSLQRWEGKSEKGPGSFPSLEAVSQCVISSQGFFKHHQQLLSSEIRLGCRSFRVQGLGLEGQEVHIHAFTVFIKLPCPWKR